MTSIADLRRVYTLQGLQEADMKADPIAQFRLWFDQVLAAELIEPNAMTLSTAEPSGIPSARIVLLKGVDEHGFVFFTNYLSTKGRQLAENPRAALVFFWPELERQVRVAGDVSKTSRAESEAYFRSRPRENQIGAHVSRQGEVIESRVELEQRREELERFYEGKEVPLPENWGGFRLVPLSLEFWQGRPSRLHDRLRYVRQGKSGWKMERLCP
jgi:pyridoxamine 5'-phosphate oxidase